MPILELPSTSASEHELLETARHALSQCNWIVGKCAAEWTERYAKGRTDSDFATLVGLSVDQVFQRRRVWETFNDVFGDYSRLKWSHFYVALTWDDAPECLQWADENEATIAEMRAWRRASRGEDLSEPAEWTSQLGDDPSISQFVGVPSDVRLPDDDAVPNRERNADIKEDRGEASEYPSSTNVFSANREVEGGEYAPFRKDAVSPPPKADQGDDIEEDEKPIGQIAKRVISTLERVVTVLAPPIVNRLKSLPDKERERLVTAIRTLYERVSALETASSKS